MIVQHPCALRSNGVDLNSRLLAVEVKNFSLIPPGKWRGSFSFMPLPSLRPGLDSNARNQAAGFDSIYTAQASDLDLEKRIACLSPSGVNILLQRWVHHNSRVIIPTWQYQEVTESVFEEADLMEEWCDGRLLSGIKVEESAREFMDWIREETPGAATRQERIKNPQNRSVVRKEMRSLLSGM
jgi:hypothetical protein